MPGTTDAGQLMPVIGELVDTCDNFLAFENAFMPLPLRAEAYVSGLRTIRDRLRALYIETTGENPWDMPGMEDPPA
jgi:hypothetical protein